LTGDDKYLERADCFGQMAVALFFDATSPLPKVSKKHDWYEELSGGPNLVETMFKLGLAMGAAK